MFSTKAKPMGFRQWITCEDLKNQLIDTKGGRQFPNRMIAFLSSALDIEEKKLRKMGWDECMALFEDAVTRTKDIDVPIYKDAPKNSKGVDWDYSGRTFRYYVNLFSKAYGWSIEYISNLEVNLAFGLLQEILTDQFLDQEFSYSLSELAYPYNSATKKSVYKPMERPYWMKPLTSDKPKRVMIRKESLPVGRVVDVSGMPEEYQIKGYDTEKPEKGK